MKYYEPLINYVNYIAFNRGDFKSDEEFRKAISDSIILLISTGYTCVIRNEDYDGNDLAAVRIEYSFSGPYGEEDYFRPIWGHVTHEDNCVNDTNHLLDIIGNLKEKEKDEVEY